MEYNDILKKKRVYEQRETDITDTDSENYWRGFGLEYAHNSVAIDGNGLSIDETKTILEDGIAIGGKALREIYEVVNHKKTFEYIKKCTKDKIPLNEKLIKNIFTLQMDNILEKGVYRKEEAYLSGAKFTPPTPTLMLSHLKNFYCDLVSKSDLNPIDLAAWSHSEFIKIHPFAEGNGIIARLIMNYQLMISGFLPISIPNGKKQSYYSAIDSYAVMRNLKPLADLIMELEEKQLDAYLELL